MNILIVTPYFPPQTGGVATFLDALQRLLRQRGHEVYVLVPGTSHRISPCISTTNAVVYDFYLRVPWVPPAPIKGSLAFLCYFLPTLLRLRRFVKEKAIDLISLEYPLPSMYYFSYLKLLSKVKLIVGIHGDDVLSLHLLPKYEQWLVRRLIKKADWLLAHSSSLMTQAATIVGLSNSNTSYLPYGVESERLRVLAKREEGVFTLPKGPYILTVAKLYERKGLDILLHAVKKLGNAIKSYRVVIVGDGPQEQELKQLAIHLEIQDRIVFTGELQETAICMLYRNCEIFLLPSRSEPFGIVLLEAMTFGKPIIATRVGGIPEFVIDEYNGILIPPNDSEALARQMKRFIDDMELQSKIGRNGRTFVDEKYNYQTVIIRYEDLFQRVCGKKISLML